MNVTSESLMKALLQARVHEVTVREGADEACLQFIETLASNIDMLHKEFPFTEEEFNTVIRPQLYAAIVVRPSTYLKRFGQVSAIAEKILKLPATTCTTIELL